MRLSPRSVMKGVESSDLLGNAAREQLAPLRGSPPHFREVYEQNFEMVWRYATFHGVPPMHLDDVVQEVFIVVHGRMETFEGRSSLRGWVMGVAHNVVRDYLRKRANRPAGDHLESDTQIQLVGDSPAEAVEKKRAALLLDEILSKMNDAQREVFILSEIEQLSAPEISRALEVNENTVRTRLRAARHEFEAAVARLDARRAWEEHA
jgi:RNA polymerase sigma-70 factor (ECF subfamily)